MKIQPFSPVKDRHSFHIDVQARYWVDYDSVEELCSVLRDAAGFGLPILPVGGGNNLLFVNDYPGILLHSCLKEKTVLEDKGDEVLLKAGAGHNWDELAAWCVAQGWGGMQNLSGIPGEVGATPVQNIGAYGVEAKDIIEAVEVLDRTDLSQRTIVAADCEFGYRRSRFKTDWKDRYIVTYVHYRLSRKPVFQLNYGAVSARLEAQGGLKAGNDPQSVKDNLQMVRRTIMAIRDEKLPDPAKVGNAGSFFMNPEVDRQHFRQLKSACPDMPAWELPDGRYKLSAAWLIDQCGWKGRRLDEAGVWPTQPLVLVNYGQASGEDILELARSIIDDVKRRFDVALRPEVIILGE